MNKLLFAFPIYIRSEQKSIDALKKSKSDFIEERRLQYINLIGKIVPHQLEERWENDAEIFIPYKPWKYNEIVGWIEILYDIVGTIFPSIYLADTKRFSPLTKKINITYNCTWNYKIPHERVYIQIDNLDNITIIEKIWKLIEKLKKILPRKYFYIETESFENLSKIIDFKKLLNSKL